MVITVEDFDIIFKDSAIDLAGQSAIFVLLQKCKHENTKQAHMKLRFFTMAAMALGLSLSVSAQSSMEDNFRNPPSSAKAWTWWHWMNGNASKEGITADLEAMAAAGVGGVQAFNISIMDKGPVDYASKEWYDLMNHAMRECQRLGLEFDMHNSPGWSSTGGFWITPETSGKQVSWSLAYVKGGNKVDIIVPQPAKALGAYWDDVLIAYNEEKFMQDTHQMYLR